VLDLDLCWEDGQLRWYDPVAGRYLVTIPEEREALIAETARANSERDARIAAEARVRELQEDLRRLRGK
jgi:hypothetical protein